MIEKFFTTEQVANILQVHPFTILKFIKQGKLKGVKLGRVYRIQESDVMAFLEERMTQAGKKIEKKVKPTPSTEPQIIIREKIEENKIETKEEPKEKEGIYSIDSKNDDKKENYYVI